MYALFWSIYDTQLYYTFVLYLSHSPLISLSLSLFILICKDQMDVEYAGMNIAMVYMILILTSLIWSADGEFNELDWDSFSALYVSQGDSKNLVSRSLNKD